MQSIENYRNREFIGVAELAEAAKVVLESSEIQQNRDVVTPYPNERTVRYYLSEGLLPPADFTEGTASVFKYRHLLALILIKKLQSQGLPIRIIKRIVANRDAAELEKLLDEPVSISTDVNDARLAEMRGETVVEFSDRDEIKEILEMPQFCLARADTEPETWERHLIAEGIELHISETAGLSKKEKRKIVRDVTNLVQSK